MSRITLSERCAIEAGIYARQSLSEIAEKIGKTPKAVSREIRNNCTQVPGFHPGGNDCRMATNCKRKYLSHSIKSIKLLLCSVWKPFRAESGMIKKDLLSFSIGGIHFRYLKMQKIYFLKVESFLSNCQHRFHSIMLSKYSV